MENLIKIILLIMKKSCQSCKANRAAPNNPALSPHSALAIFTCFTPHRSAPNASDSNRRGYFLSYNARSDGGPQYESHYRAYHEWIRSKAPEETRSLLYFR